MQNLASLQEFNCVFRGILFSINRIRQRLFVLKNDLNFL